MAEIKTLTRPTEFTPRFNDNRDDEEPFKVLLRPLNREHQVQWVEINAQLAEGAQPDGASPSDVAKAIRANVKIRSDFVSLLLREYVAGSKDLKQGGKEVGIDVLFGLIDQYPKLEEEVFQAVLNDGKLTEDDRKN